MRLVFLEISRNFCCCCFQIFFFNCVTVSDFDFDYGFTIDIDLHFFLILAFYGVLFPTDQEAAFSNYRLWESVGFVVSFAYANFICTDVKIYILIGVLSIGIILYAIIELIRKREMSTNIQWVCKGWITDDVEILGNPLFKMLQ